MGMGILGCGVTLSLRCLSCFLLLFLFFFSSWFRCRSRDSLSSSGSWWCFCACLSVAFCMCVRERVSEGLYPLMSYSYWVQKTALITYTLIFSPTPFFSVWAINVVHQSFAWHSQICANGVRALRGSSTCYTIYLNHYTVHKDVRIKWRWWAVPEGIQGQMVDTTLIIKTPQCTKPRAQYWWNLFLK